MDEGRVRNWWQSSGGGALRRALFSLALALLLWGWATNLEDPETSRSLAGIVPAIVGRAEGLMVLDESKVPAATVQVRGPRSVVERLVPSELVATIDLSGVKEPTTTAFPLRVQAPRRVRVVDADPSTASLTIDRLTSKTFPLEVEKGPTPPSYSIGPVEVATPQIEVRGSASAVERVARVVLPVTLGDRRETFEAPFTPEARDARGERVSGVTIGPATISAVVPVERVGRIVSIVTDINGQPPDQYRLAGTTVSPSFVTVDGPPDLLNRLIVVSTEPIDVAGRTGSFSAYDVPLVLPPNIRLVDRPTINVQVQIEPQQQRQQFPALRVVQVNTGSGLRATVTPEEIAVTLSAPLERLRSLNSDDIRVEVDLQGLVPGTYTLPVRIVVPPDLRLVDAPPVVSVRIEPAATPVPPRPATPSSGPRRSGS